MFYRGTPRNKLRAEVMKSGEQRHLATQFHLCILLSITFPLAPGSLVRQFQAAVFGHPWLYEMRSVLRFTAVYEASKLQPAILTPVREVV
jgi:hypothetical protein